MMNSEDLLKIQGDMGKAQTTSQTQALGQMGGGGISLNPMDIVRMICRYWHWMVGMLVLCLMIAWVKLKSTAPVYTRTASVLIKDKNSGEWRLSTFYLAADNPQSAFMSRLMLDMLLSRNMEKHKSFPQTQMLVVFDDLDKLPKFESLENALSFGFESNISLLLLTQGLKSISEIYGKAWIENMLSCCSYKLLFAQDNVALSRQFRALAVFGAKTLQIPAFKTRAFSKVKHGVADAFYYRKIADDLLNFRENKKITNGQHLLLVSGFYNLPVKVDAERFNLDARFNLLSQKKAPLSLPAAWVSRRDEQDVRVPSSAYVLEQDQKARVVASRVKTVSHSENQKMFSHVPSPENDNTHFSKAEPVVLAQASGSDDDWWMDEGAFAVQNEEDVGLLKNC